MYSYIQDKTITNHWCFWDIDIPESYGSILDDMKQGHIIIVSDGSFHPSTKTGCAAWIMEGTSSRQQIVGCVITPGQDDEQSSYRSELSGILAALTFINTLATFHKISVPLTLRCDCETGVEKSFSRKTPTLQDNCYDLLAAIHDEVQHTLIHWSGLYIKGHQDTSVPFSQLDRPGQLNVIVDKMAKDYLPTAMSSPKHYRVSSSSWSISINTFLIVGRIESRLYDLVHSLVAKDYWLKKNRIATKSFEDVLWTRLGQAMDRMPLHRRLFCSKHTSGMCGVGKFNRYGK
jgi:hypothetical protein